jgi:hypothetical protein
LLADKGLDNKGQEKKTISQRFLLLNLILLNMVTSFWLLKGCKGQKSQPCGGTMRNADLFRIKAKFTALRGFCSLRRCEKRLSRTLESESAQASGELAKEFR